jgi:DNA-binding SARP family transcriptional activator/WD40 repeat protein
MGIGVLGPVVSDGGVAFGRRDRAVPTALSLQVGQPVSEEQLIDAVWGGEPPRSAHKSLQGCVFRIRQALGSDVIRTSPQGYALMLPADDVDARRFERMVSRGRELMALGEPDRAAYLLGEALELWRGTPFQDLELSDLAAIEAERLEELRKEAEELRVEASLRSGRHLEVLATAEVMVKAAPLRERRWRLLALAQYQAGRQTEALRTVHRVKKVLAEQLGIDPGPELAAMEEAILRQDDSLLASAPIATTSVCPYRGLLPFDLDDHESFFGRDDDVRACLDILRDRGAVSVVGPSGSGKSSLARAGIAATLRLRGQRVTVITPGAEPSDRLAALPRASERTVLVVDQCEEVFASCRDESARAAFLAGLVRWAERGRLVMAMRADRLADVSAYPPFARLMERSLYLLGAMTEGGLRAAIQAPARQAGLLIEPGLVDLLVGEVADTAGGLPLLSHALMETWQRREANTLTVEGYTASGGIRGAVAQSAESVYAGIAPDQRIVLRDLVLRLVSSGTQGEPVRAKVPRRLFSDEPEHQQLIDLLVGSRLVTSDAGVVEVAHEALARAWPRLRTWLDEDLEGQRIRQHLTSAADAWDTLGRPDSELYRGVRLTQALQWRDRSDTRLTTVELAFLEAAESSEQTERRAEQARSRAQTRFIRRLRLVLAVAVALLVLALAAGLTAFQQRNRAEESADAASAAGTSAEARRAGAAALSTEDKDESMLLAVAGVRLDDSPETRSSLLAALARHPELTASTELSGEEVIWFDVSPDGTEVVTYDSLNRVRLYDLTSGARLAQVQVGDPVPLQIVSQRVRFSPDGTILAVTVPPPTRRPVMLLDADSLEPLAEQPGGMRWAQWQSTGLSFSEDGGRLAAQMWRVKGRDAGTGWKGTWAFVWDVPAPGHPVAQIFVGDQTDAQTPALTPSGHALITTHPLTRHDLVTGKAVVLTEPRGRNSVEALQMSPNRALLGVAGERFGAAVLDPRTGRELRDMKTDEDDFPFYLSFSDDGRRMSSVEWLQRQALVWDVSSGKLVSRVPLGMDGEAMDLGTDGSSVYTAGSDGALRHWDVNGLGRFIPRVAVAPYRGEGGLHGYPAPGGRTIAYVGDADVMFFDVDTGVVTAKGRRGEGLHRRAAAAWQPDGRHFALATGSEIRVWDASAGRLAARAAADGPVASLDYSADGTTLVVGELSGRVRAVDEDLRPIGPAVQLEHPSSEVAAGPDGRSAVVLTGFDSGSPLFGRNLDHWVLVDLSTGQVVREAALGSEVADVDFSPDGRHFAVGGGHVALQIIDAATGETVGLQRTTVSQPNWVSYSQDGSRVIASTADAMVVLRDGRTGELISRVSMPARFTIAGFGEDSHSVLILGEFGGDIFRWDTHLARAVDFACSVAGRDFSQREWAEQFGDRPFQQTCPGPAAEDSPSM